LASAAPRPLGSLFGSFSPRAMTESSILGRGRLEGQGQTHTAVVGGREGARGGGEAAGREGG